MSKPKGQLDKLADGEHAQLVSWLLAGMSYLKAIEVIKNEWGLVTNKRQLSVFWERYCEPQFLERQRGAKRLAESVLNDALASPQDFDKATALLLSRISFDLANKASAMSTIPKQTVKDIKALFALVQKRGSLEFEKEKFRASLMTKLEAAMEALHAEVKDNPKALAAFNAMKEAIAK